MMKTIRFIHRHSTVQFYLRNYSTQKSHQESVAAKKLPIKIPIPGVQHVILVSSAKGGVGKSSITINLAFALQRLDKNNRVGILDADVFGPSIPRMLNLADKKVEVDKQNLFIPLKNYGINCMSMGFLIDQQDALIWRGLMVMQAIGQLLRKVKWGQLDYLLIDMPPGTGDVQLSIIQNIPVSGSLIVTTPQNIATQDASKSIVMYKSIKCEILGIVQNMSGYKCSKCQTVNHLFGKDGAKKLAELHHITMLGDVPINEKIQLACDQGKPIDHADKELIDCFDTICLNLVKQLGHPLVS